MGSSKIKPLAGKKANKWDQDEELVKVKDGRVNKSMDGAKAVRKGAKLDKVAEAAKKLQEAASSASDSDDGSSSDGSSASESKNGAQSESDSESNSDRESDDGVAKPKSVKTNGISKSNGVNANKDSASDSGSGSESDDASGSSDSDSGSDDEKASSRKVSKPAVAGTKAQTKERSISSDSDNDSDEATAKGAKASTSAKLQSTVDDDASNSYSSSSDEDEPDNEKGAFAKGDDGQVSKKRKADEVSSPVQKKTRTEGGVSKTLFVGNLSWNIDEEWLKSEFQGFGEVLNCRIMTHADSGKSKGFGFVDFGSEEDANKAYESMNGFFLDGRSLKVDVTTTRDKNETPNRRESTSNRADRFGDARSPPSETLFVGNISWSATAEQLKEAFGPYGEVLRVALPTDRDTGELKGYGYVAYGSSEEAQAAINELNGAYIAGRNIRLDFATPRPDNDRGGFRGGRGGRGGGMADRPGKWERGGFGGGRGGRGDRGDSRGGRGGFTPRGGRGDRGGGRGGSTNRGGVGDFSGTKITF